MSVTFHVLVLGLPAWNRSGLIYEPVGMRSIGARALHGDGSFYLGDGFRNGKYPAHQKTQVYCGLSVSPHYRRMYEMGSRKFYHVRLRSPILFSFFCLFSSAALIIQAKCSSMLAFSRKPFSSLCEENTADKKVKKKETNCVPLNIVNDIGLGYTFLCGLPYHRFKRSTLDSPRNAFTQHHLNYWFYFRVRLLLRGSAYFTKESHGRAFCPEKDVRNLFSYSTVEPAGWNWLSGQVFKVRPSPGASRSAMTWNASLSSASETGVVTSDIAVSSNWRASGRFLMTYVALQSSVVRWPSQIIRSRLYTAVATT